MGGLTVTERILTLDAYWREYLRITRECDQERYEEVEPWAWARLQRDLKPLRRKKAA